MGLELRKTEEWHDVDADLFRNKIRPRGRPAILRGLIRHWPAVAAGKVSPMALNAYIKQFCSSVPVPQFEGPPEINGRFFYNDTLDGFNFELKRGLLGEFMDRLCRHLQDSAPPAMYAGSLSIPIFLPGFSRENNIASFIASPSALESIWVGNRTCIAPHFDQTENIACVVGGRRRFTMFPIEQIGNMYVGPFDLTPAGQPISLVEVRNPDFGRFPRFAEALAAAEVAELEPGDAVYVPTLWWHNVEALSSFNVLVNYWWREVPNYFESPANSLLHCLLSIKSLPPEQRRGWRAIFDYLIFQSEGPALEHLPPRVRGLFGELSPEAAARIRALLLKHLGRQTD